MIATLNDISKWTNEVSNKKSAYKGNVAAEFDIINSAKQVVIQKAIWEVLNEVLDVVSTYNDNLTKATPRIKDFLVDTKEICEELLYADYETPEDMRLEATAKVKTVNKLLRML